MRNDEAGPTGTGGAASCVRCGSRGALIHGETHSHARRTVNHVGSPPASARMQEAAAAARGVRSMVGFNYRHVPALAMAKALVRAGRLGAVRHVRAQYLQDFIVDEDFPLTWRRQKERAGAGALGDIGSHIIDAAQFVSGQHIDEVSGTTETFVRHRPLDERGGGSGLAA